MNLALSAGTTLSDPAREFVNRTEWRSAAGEFLAGDASTRKYFRLRLGGRTSVLMDASQNLESVAPFLQLTKHLRMLGLSSPNVLAQDAALGFLLLEDFGDAVFARLLESPGREEELFGLATDVLATLHRHAQAIPAGLRAYDPGKMLDDIELFLEWRVPAISEQGRAEFRVIWRDVLPAAHRVPISLLLRDYHVANLMWLPDRPGVQRVGLLDFQDAYQGPITYDLVSLLEDARRDVAPELRRLVLARYGASFPELDSEAFEESLAILAAQRHTRVLAIFERLSRHYGKPDYKRLHSPRVERLLRQALRHPRLSEVKRWMRCYCDGWED